MGGMERGEQEYQAFNIILLEHRTHFPSKSGPFHEALNGACLVLDRCRECVGFLSDVDALVLVKMVSYDDTVRPNVQYLHISVCHILLRSN